MGVKPRCSIVLRSGMDQQFISSAVGAARFTASAFPTLPFPPSPADAGNRIRHRLAAGTGRNVDRSGRLNLPQRGMRASLKSGASGAARSWPGHPLHKQAEPRVVVVRRLALS